jgi:tetratricopeptide (TPR) repeat protein
LGRAARHFEAAIARDPEFALAHAWLSDVYALHLVMIGRPTNDEIVRARSLARQAVSLDPTLADVHWALGQVLMCFDWDLLGAEREFRSALALDPGHVDARHLLGIALLHSGRLDDAMLELEQAIVTDPLAHEARATLGRVYQSRSQNDKAIACYREVLELSPGIGFPRIGLALTLAAGGQYDEALVEGSRAIESAGPRGIAALAYVQALSGLRDEALKTLSTITEHSDYSAPYHIAIAYVGLGDHDAAICWLDRAVQNLDPWVTAMKIDPAFASLRDDLRFAALTRRIGLTTR